MRRFWAGSFVSLCLAHAAYAADQPVQAPPPAWVKPVALPAAPGASGAAVQILLQDQQMNVTAEGLEVYAETATRIQTSQGLAAVGTLQIPWKPSTDTLTIHKVQILRDGRVIDVLAGQSFTVLRREMNLEYAALDGVLTATLQPEDLRVGDILSLAFSIRRVDPVLKGMTDWSLEGPADYPVAHMSLRARWSHDVAMHWQASEALKDMKQARDGDAVEVAMAQDDVQPLVQPAGAPLRFVQLRRAEFSNFPSWGAVSGLMYPLFVKAAVLPDRSPLKAEAARLKAASPDRKAQAAAALALVQDHIRYVFLGLNDGGLVPATADETWSRRFGDCKAKTVLLLALLHELDIPAEAVLVNTPGR
ncbi:MAG: DUF3857 domain-containing protein [Azospirillaceae bacterium]|nr:DUF3857 domain-containing protein [Azospirillaceae bacterium]